MFLGSFFAPKNEQHPCFRAVPYQGTQNLFEKKAGRACTKGDWGNPQNLNGDFTGTETTMMICIIDDAELAGGDSMDRVFGVDHEGIGGSPLQGGGMILWGMTNLKCDFGGS